MGLRAAAVGVAFRGVGVSDWDRDGELGTIPGITTEREWEFTLTFELWLSLIARSGRRV